MIRARNGYSILSLIGIIAAVIGISGMFWYVSSWSETKGKAAKTQDVISESEAKEVDEDETVVVSEEVRTRTFQEDWQSSTTAGINRYDEDGVLVYSISTLPASRMDRWGNNTVSSTISTISGEEEEAPSRMIIKTRKRMCKGAICCKHFTYGAYTPDWADTCLGIELLKVPGVEYVTCGPYETVLTRADTYGTAEVVTSIAEVLDKWLEEDHESPKPPSW